MSGGRKIRHCHWRVAKIARELAAASYEQLMSQDLLYSAWKKQNPEIAGQPKKLLQEFVRRKWGLYIEAARATLVGVLVQPTSASVDDKMKEEIMETLALDSTLIRGRVHPKVLAGTITGKH